MLTIIGEVPEDQPEGVREEVGPEAEAVQAHLLLPIGWGLIRDIDVVDKSSGEWANQQDMEERVRCYAEFQGGPIQPTLSLPGNPCPTFPLLYDGEHRYGGGTLGKEMIRKTLHYMVDHYVDRYCDDEVKVVARVSSGFDPGFQDVMNKVWKGFGKIVHSFALRVGQPTPIRN